MRLTKVLVAAAVPLTMLATTIATGASASAAIPMLAGVGVHQPLDDPGGPDTGPDPNAYNGGQAGGGTGPASAPSTTDPSFWNGGEAAGGTGPADAGPNTGGGPGPWNGGEAGGAV